MRRTLLAACLVGAIFGVNQAYAGDYQLQTGIHVNWQWPSFAWWGAARYPHGGHWVAIGYPPEIFHPYPWFLVYPTGVAWPSTPGWTPYSGYPGTPWAGYTYYPTPALPSFPGWPDAHGTAPAGQTPVTGWQAPQAPPYYWFGR